MGSFERGRRVVRTERSRLRPLGVALVAATAVVALGCGGGDGDVSAKDLGSSSTADPTAADEPGVHDGTPVPAGATSEVRVTRADASPWGTVGADIVHCLATAEQTGGAYSFLEVEVPVGSGPPSHQHADADEWFYVLSGTATLQAGDLVTAIGPGDYIHVPRGTTHTFTATAPLKMVAGYLPGGEEQRLFCPT